MPCKLHARILTESEHHNLDPWGGSSLYLVRRSNQVLKWRPLLSSPAPMRASGTRALLREVSRERGPTSVPSSHWGLCTTSRYGSTHRQLCSFERGQEQLHLNDHWFTCDYHCGLPGIFHCTLFDIADDPAGLHRFHGDIGTGAAA